MVISSYIVIRLGDLKLLILSGDFKLLCVITVSFSVSNYVLVFLLFVSLGICIFLSVLPFFLPSVSLYSGIVFFSHSFPLFVSDFLLIMYLLCTLSASHSSQQYEECIPEETAQ